MTLEQFTENLESLAKGFKTEFLAEAKLIALKAQEEAKRLASTKLHKRSGNLVDSIKGEAKLEGDGFSLNLTASAPYAGIHEFGGVIRPRKGKFLRIPVGGGGVGAMHFRPSSRGGGVLIGADGSVKYILKEQVKIPARPFLGPVAQEVPAWLEKAFADVVQRGIEQ